MKSNQNMSTIYNILVVGDDSWLKTQFINQYVECTPLYTNTAIDYRVCTAPVENRSFKLHIYDTMGHEYFRSITFPYYRISSAVIVLCDRSAPLHEAKKWIHDAKLNCPENTPIVLVITNNPMLDYTNKFNIEDIDPDIEYMVVAIDNRSDISRCFNALLERITFTEIKIIPVEQLSPPSKRHRCEIL